MSFPSGEKSYGLWRTRPLVSPGVCEEVEETIKTLLFADRRRRIQTLVSRGIFKNDVITTGIKGESVFFSVLTSQFIRGDLHQYFPGSVSNSLLEVWRTVFAGASRRMHFSFRSIALLKLFTSLYYGILIKPLIVTF